MLKFRILLVCFLLVPLMSFSQFVNPKVGAIGSLWIVTIDNSGSMLYGHNGRYYSKEEGRKNINSVIREVLQSGEFLNSVDFSCDVFLFFTSGYDTIGETYYGKRMKSAPAFDKSFIHHTDACLHHFEDKESIIRYICNIVDSIDFKYNSSFVSQIRTFSAIKAINYMKAEGREDSFLNMKLLTITDDADQNDQWRSDYRELKQADPKKVKMVSDSTTKYVFNPLNGFGAGRLEEICSFDTKVPHIWLYDYATRQSIDTISVKKLFRIRASNGRDVVLAPIHNIIGGQAVDYYIFDTLLVNGECYPIEMDDRSIYSIEYRNRFWHNDVMVRGSVWLSYEDSIYGKHYRKVPFVQSARPLPMHILLFLGLILLCLAITVLYHLLKRNTVAWIETSRGDCVRVKRGRRHNWKGPLDSLVCFNVDHAGKCVSVLWKKHRNVAIHSIGRKDIEPVSVLVRSHRELAFMSSNIVMCDTREDVEGYYEARSGAYPEVLKNYYRGTMYYKLYNRHGSISRWICHCINKYFPEYYYVLSIGGKNETLCFESNSLLKNHMFMIETNVLSKQSSATPLIESLVSNYYKNSKRPADFLVGCCEQRSDMEWIVLKVDDGDIQNVSLRRVKVVMHFVQSDADRSTIPSISSKIAKYVKVSCGGHVFVDTKHDVSVESGNTIGCGTLGLDCAIAELPKIVTFVEGRCSKPHVRQIYSPLENGGQKQLIIKLNESWENGYLYYSILPYAQSIMFRGSMKKITDTIVRTGAPRYHAFSIEKGMLVFDNIREQIN